MWLSGPHDAAKQDISVFRGAENEDDDRDNWDRNALLWQLEEDEHLVCDSGYAGGEKVILYAEDLSPEFKRLLADA